MDHCLSEGLWREAQTVLPGGVNSPVRAFKSVGGNPFFVRSGKGALLTDEDGNTLIDYVLSWGPLAVGHAHPEVVDAVKEAAEKGFGYGIPTSLETSLAQRLIRHFPSMDRVRFVNSGTEATMSAIRLARGFTNRDLIVKMDGCYHGHGDNLLVRAGSGVATLGLPDSPGVPAATSAQTLVVPYNDEEAITTVFNHYGEEIACVIVEPVAGNMGVVIPKPGYLQKLRDLTAAAGALLIFDEVMTGFRVSLGGAQEHFGITPDLTTLGKVIGGGLPVGAYGGAAAVMDLLAPQGPVYQAGTLSGNPMTMTAGLKSLEILARPGIFEGMTKHLEMLCTGLADLLQQAGIPAFQRRIGTMACTFFTDNEVYDYTSAKESDTEVYKKWFRGMLNRGVYFAPSQFEAAFVSSAHNDDTLNKTLEAAQQTIKNDL
ncbi:MAG: glutamate-1-semialdehyde 2,1-aminomutase [Candidatus Hydrogenedentales bacterium]|jgi:glutamate-1-semialdehyde 2,1-aminomutase